MESRDWLYVATLVIQGLIFGAIFRKAGYNGWLGLLMMVPMVNLGVLAWFATTNWPLEAGATLSPVNPRAGSNWDLKMALKQGIAHETQGEYKHAILHYQHV